MIDKSTEAGARPATGLREKPIIWPTTARSDGQPQSSAVWFLWETGALLIYSQPYTRKVGNVAGHPEVSLHLDDNGQGGNIVTIEGTAAIDCSAPTAVAIRATPRRVRAW